jgi:hypothetical protein
MNQRRCTVAFRCARPMLSSAMVRVEKHDPRCVNGGVSPLLHSALSISAG